MKKYFVMSENFSVEQIVIADKVEIRSRPLAEFAPYKFDAEFLDSTGRTAAFVKDVTSIFDEDSRDADTAENELGPPEGLL